MASKDLSSWNPRQLTQLQWFMIRTGIIVGSGGILFGYDIGVVAGALDQLGDEFNLDDWQKGMVVSLISAGSIIGCIVGGPVCDYFGRWFTIHLQNIVFIVGALTIAFASSIDTVYVGRVIVGIAAALSGIADCAYLNEVAPTEYRGRLSSLYELLTCVGVLLSFIIDLCLAEDSNGWRIMFGLPSIFALIQSLALFTMPETPKWLAQQKRYGECEEVLLHIYGDKEAASHAYQEIQEELRTDAQPVSNYNPLHRSSGEKREDPLPAPSSSPSSSSPSSAVLWREYRIPLIVILALQILSQLSGGIVIRNYAPTIFEDAGLSNRTALLLNVFLGIVKLIVVIVSISYVDFLGRKLLLQWCCVIIGGGMVLLSIGFVAGLGHSAALFMCGCSLAIGGYSIGFGPVNWILSTELFPTSIRGRAVSTSVVVTNIAQFLTNLVFLPLVSLISAAGTFFIFAAFNGIAWLFITLYVTETMDKSPAEILRQLQGVWSSLTSVDAVLSAMQTPARTGTKDERSEESDHIVQGYQHSTSA